MDSLSGMHGSGRNRKHESIPFFMQPLNQALSLQAQGDTDQGIAALEKALTLAEPGGLIRTFVDEGPPMARRICGWEYRRRNHGRDRSYSVGFFAWRSLMKEDEPTLDRPATYQIQVPGELDESWSDWVGSLTIAVESEGDGPPATTLTGTLDQAALHSVLRRL